MPIAHLLLNIIELILVRSSINAVSVRKPSASMHTLVNITEFILVRNLMSALNVENSSDIVQSFSDIRNYTVVNNPDRMTKILVEKKWEIVKDEGALLTVL